MTDNLKKKIAFYAYERLKYAQKNINSQRINNLIIQLDIGSAGRYMHSINGLHLLF